MMPNGRFVPQSVNSTPSPSLSRRMTAMRVRLQHPKDGFKVGYGPSMNPMSTADYIAGCCPAYQGCFAFHLMSTRP